MDTAYDPTYVTFNDSDTGSAANWLAGQFSDSGDAFMSSYYSVSNLILGGVFTEAGDADLIPFE